MSLFSVIIPHFNGIQILTECLESLFLADPDVEVILVDNGSVDQSVSVVRQQFPQVIVMEPGENLGYAGGCTFGASKATGDWLIFLNNDTYTDPAFFRNLAEVIKQKPEAHAFQPKIRSLQAFRNNEFRFDYAGAAGGRIDWLGYPFAWGRLMDQIETDSGQFDEPRTIFWASGTAMVVRRTIAVQQAFFDPIFFAHMEEIDLCWRILAAGGVIYSAPDCVMYHLGGQTLALGHPRKMYLNHRNNWLMVIKNTPLWYLILISPARLLLDLIASLAYLKSHGQTGFLVVFRAWKWIVLNLFRIRKTDGNAANRRQWKQFRLVLSRMDPVPVVIRRVFRLTT